VSARKGVVERYFDGFRRSDHQQILACLTDDVAWDLPGYTHLTGKDAFDQEIENPEFVGSPTLTVDRAIERLTRRPGETYPDYIERVATNKIARRVKIVDVTENLANNRRSPSSPGNPERITRYEAALARLDPE